MEITLRTEVAVEAMGAVMEAFPDLRVGGGTVLRVKDLERLSICGADFAVSPGYTESLTRCAREFGLPFLPGVATPSEVMAGMELGLTCFKLFPAEALGGAAFLKAMQAPFPGIRFCPTGGIGAETAGDYRSLSNVLCVGGTWLSPPELVKEQRWDEIESRTRSVVGQTA